MKFKLGDTVRILKRKPFEPYRGSSVIEAWEHSRDATVDDYELVVLDTAEKVDDFNRMGPKNMAEVVSQSDCR